MMEDGIDLQVVEATARYKAPARFDDELDLTIEVTKLGTTSMVTALAIHRDGTLLVEGELVHVFVDSRRSPSSRSPTASARRLPRTRATPRCRPWCAPSRSPRR